LARIDNPNRKGVPGDDPHRERLERYEVHLDRKFERTLATRLRVKPQATAA
jgi:hypothetical protein